MVSGTLALVFPQCTTLVAPQTVVNFSARIPNAHIGFGNSTEPALNHGLISQLFRENVLFHMLNTWTSYIERWGFWFWYKAIKNSFKTGGRWRGTWRIIKLGSFEFVNPWVVELLSGNHKPPFIADFQLPFLNTGGYRIFRIEEAMVTNQLFFLQAPPVRKLIWSCINGYYPMEADSLISWWYSNNYPTTIHNYAKKWLANGCYYALPVFAREPFLHKIPHLAMCRSWTSAGYGSSVGLTSLEHQTYG